VRPAKTIITSFSKRFLIRLDSFAETFTSGHHHGDGNNSPGDAEHGQHGSAFMRPQRAKRIFQQILE
jgi:hypothetical protein